MLNFTDSVTVTTKTPTSVDADTGTPIYSDVTAMVGQPAAFSVLSASQHSEAWGGGATTTQTEAVTASLVVPSWAPDLDGSDRHTVIVQGYAGTWRVLSKRPGARWSTYLIALN